MTQQTAPGTVALVEIRAARPEQTIPFYEAVLGWTFQPMGPIWAVNAGDGGPLVAVMIPRGDHVPEVGAPINGVVARVVVPDVDAATEAGLALGGIVALPAEDYPGVGRVGYLIDPDHNVVALFTPEA